MGVCSEADACPHHHPPAPRPPYSKSSTRSSYAVVLHCPRPPMTRAVGHPSVRGSLHPHIPPSTEDPRSPLTPLYLSSSVHFANTTQPGGIACSKRRDMDILMLDPQFLFDWGPDPQLMSFFFRLAEGREKLPPPHLLS